jgi:hypothetical protein
MGRIRVDERHLEPEQPAVGLLVDHLHALLGELGQLTPQVGHLIRDVVHSRPSFREEPANVSVIAEGSDEFHSALADAYGGRLDTLRFNQVAVLELGAEHPSVRLDRLVEVLDGDP